ncbi:hypothetical protein AURDEDRAFT_171356 [Auricularia subglabra TFB-10046 SS5]|uniref:Uncharacterized protein n=1 Tax=Auricularia subglabra (strain TFB-10046 / SS5) TaxID=717982 RepID=J0LIU8_AURST|nr:hypothetical protein AURDEDRAFT_171356 [Auricularia subglabra TFB-10046 SS5]
MPQSATGTVPFNPRFSAVHTDYSNNHIATGAFSAADLAFQSGAVVVNGQGEVLLLEDTKTGRIELPRSGLPATFDIVVKSPLKFVEEKTGLVVERHPLLKPTRRYYDPGVGKWGLLEQELQFSDRTTTNAFSVGLDVIYIRRPEFPDSRQSITSWYSGLVRDHPPSGFTHNGVRLHFMTVEQAIQAVQDSSHDHVGAAALTLFDALMEATQERMAEQA